MWVMPYRSAGFCYATHPGFFLFCGQLIERKLIERREMLEEYFSLVITEDGKIESIPLLLEGFMPNMDRLPEFLMRLGPGVGYL